MELVLLGTGYPLPDPDRAGPATLIKAAGMNLLFDCGRGVLMRLRGAGVGPPGIHGVFLTHLHSDHMTDFNDIVTMHWAMSFQRHPLNVYGPPGTKAMCDATIELLRPDIAWRIAHHADLTWEPDIRVTEMTQGVIFEENGVRIVVDETKHPPVKPCIGFRVEHEGKSIVIGGDGIPCDGLDRLCKDADVYVQTVLRRPLIKAISASRLQEILTYHSSTEDAAKTAAKGGVGKLVFTHLMPAPAPGTEQDWINDAKQHFDGEVVVANDLQAINV